MVPARTLRTGCMPGLSADADVGSNSICSGHRSRIATFLTAAPDPELSCRCCCDWLQARLAVLAPRFSRDSISIHSPAPNRFGRIARRAHAEGDGNQLGTARDQIEVRFHGILVIDGVVPHQESTQPRGRSFALAFSAGCEAPFMLTRGPERHRGPAPPPRQIQLKEQESEHEH
jgi:hypothetical protein